MISQLERNIFESIQKEYEEAGVGCGIVEPSDQVPYVTLITIFDEVGEQSRQIQMESNFFPSDQLQDHILLLQSFTLIHKKAIPYHQPELLRLLAAVNYTLPLGSFGLIEAQNMVYYKHNAMMLKEAGLEQLVRQVDAQNGTIMHIHQLYVDAIDDVATGKRTCDQALKDLNMR